MKIAIIGAGIAGLAAARRLHPANEVTIYERQSRPGGHSRTICLELKGRPVAVDTGFIVYNEFNYPRLTRLFADLAVPTQSTSMSFGVSADNGRQEWSSNSWASLFADPTQMVSPPFLGMLIDIVRFHRMARRDLRNGTLRDHTLGSYLAVRRLGRRFRDHYLIPMGAAIWCMPDEQITDFPAGSFLRFFENHGLLGGRRHKWRTVRGGSAVYVERLVAPFKDRLRLNCAVAAIRRTGPGVSVIDRFGCEETYDQIVMACHSDTALSLLNDADTDERRILGDLRYTANDVYLHEDPGLMPRRHRAWSSWNVVIPEVSGLTRRKRRYGVTYWMNRLQRIRSCRPLFVSVNPCIIPRDEFTIDYCRMDHPRIDRRAIAARQALPTIQGRRRTWYCGAYTGSGFHEDGLTSGETVADAITEPDARIPSIQPAFRQAAE